MKKIILIVFLITNAISFSKMKYDFPYQDALSATIIGSSTLLKSGVTSLDDMTLALDERSLNFQHDFKFPTSLWYEDGFKYSLVKQDEKAPLIFLIAGSGSAHDSIRMEFFQRIFYDRGYHVISISSPLNPNFLLNASGTKMPGLLMQDASDIYSAMQNTLEDCKNEIEISDIYLLGYSLGGTEAAFVSYLDDQQKKLNLKRTMVINPAVNLRDSANRLDNLLDDNLTDKRKIGGLIDEVLNEITKQMKNQKIDFSIETILGLFKEKVISNQKMAAIIGFAFRMTSTDLVYITDVVNSRNVYIKEPVSRNASTYNYFKKINFANFEDYYQKLIVPFYEEKNYSEKQVLEGLSLRKIDSYLKNTDKIGVATNRDELILNQADIKYLEETFKKNLVVYPYGGHCGNMFYDFNLQQVFNFLEKGVLIDNDVD